MTAYTLIMPTPQSKLRAVMKSGTLYSVQGEGDWLYLGQITPEHKVGFFRYRNKEIVDIEKAIASPIMNVVLVGTPSISRALRSGLWEKLGRRELVGGLVNASPGVHWPAGTLEVTVCCGEDEYQTVVHDPTIQEYEIMSVWDAEHHIPARLTADFGEEPPAWDIGGPIWRERKVIERRAIKFPDAPYHQLLPGWVPTD